MSVENTILKEDNEYVRLIRENVSKSPLAKANYYIDQYKPIWLFLVALYFIFGFDILTPNAKNKELAAKVDTVQQHVARALDSTNNKVDSLNKKVDVLVSSTCLTTKLTPEVRRAIHLNCTTP